MVLKSKSSIVTGLWIANAFLFIISGVLSINMFVQFSEIYWVKGLFVLMGTVFEAGRVAAFVGMILFFLMAIREKKDWAWIPAVASGILYLILASIVVLASIGFSSGNFNKQSEKVAVQKADVLQKIRDLENINVELNLAYDTKKALLKKENRKSWELENVDELIKNLKKERDGYKKAPESSKKAETKVRQTIFDDIQSVIGGDANFIKGYLLLAFAGILEILLQLTNMVIFLIGYFERKDKEAEEPEYIVEKRIFNSTREVRDIVKTNSAKLLAFTEALMDIPTGLNRLNANPKIKEKTGLTDNECELFKGVLNSGIRKGELYLISTVVGASTANFDKTTIIGIIKDICEGKV